MHLDSGISAYIRAVANVEVSFPVDLRGNAHICCMQCRFFRPSYQKCGLNDEVCAFPNKYVGSECPLKLVEKE